MSLMLSAVLILTACNGKECKPEIVIKTKEVKIPIKCYVPKVDCNITGTPAEKVAGMGTCIISLKEAAKVCQ